MKVLNARFRFLPEEGEALIHPFSFGNIHIETASGIVSSHEEGNRDAFFLLDGVTELLRGLGELRDSPRTKKYVFKPSHGGFDLVFERRKNAMIALNCRNRVQDVYPESQVYSAFLEAANEFASQYQHRFLLTDGDFDAAINENLEEFSAAIDTFRQQDIRLHGNPAAPGTEAKPEDRH